MPKLYQNYAKNAVLVLILNYSRDVEVQRFNVIYEY